MTNHDISPGSTAIFGLMISINPVRAHPDAHARMSRAVHRLRRPRGQTPWPCCLSLLAHVTGDRKIMPGGPLYVEVTQCQVASCDTPSSRPRVLAYNPVPVRLIQDFRA